ncbi:MAG TPA: Hsp20/alpha crystallin family protein [Chitinophagaceae bacterium]|nr:Hsp20/alpha crystallin family protein [Chitinophagaceae bacterium]
MNTVKLKQFPASTSFNNLMDDFFMQFPSLYRDDVATSVNKTVPVNVREVENGYQVEVVVPGFNKEDIKVNLENNQITISAAKKQEATKGKVIRSEYKYQDFKRTFNLDEKIDTEKIEGRYENGVLTLNLYNKEEVKAPVKQITIQ